MATRAPESSYKSLKSEESSRKVAPSRLLEDSFCFLLRSNFQRSIAQIANVSWGEYLPWPDDGIRVAVPLHHDDKAFTVLEIR